MSDLGVGLIGVNAERGWAREAHVPAIRATSGLTLAAVATRRQETADAAATAFDVPAAFGDPRRLIDDPDVDVVVVASSVSAHRSLIGAALRAGKHVLTEWPLAVGTADMAALAAEASNANVRTGLGLQSRRNPAALRASELLGEGAIGRVLAARVFSSTAAFGGQVDDEAAALEDPAAGMHLLTIQAAHTLDLLAVLVGTPTHLAAMTTTRFPEPVLTSGGTVRRVLPDHVLAHGRLPAGGAFTVEVIGGSQPERAPFRLEIEGTDGVLQLDGGAPRGFQSGLLRLRINDALVPVEGPALPDPVVNVAGVYRALHDDIRHGTRTAPTFDDGARLSHLLDDVLRSSTDGQLVQPSAPWPFRSR